MKCFVHGASPPRVTTAPLSRLNLHVASVSALALLACAPAARAQEAAVNEPTLPEVEVVIPDQPPAQSAAKPAAPKPTAQKSKPVAPAPKPVSAPAPEPVSFETAEPATAAEGWPANGNSDAPGVPGTGTTGIDGYVATGTSTATKTNTPLIDIPQSITIITAQQAEDRGSETVGEALLYVPGVAVAQGEGHRDAITIRGQRTTADFYVDGVRDDIEYYRDLYNVEAIEVLKGPAAMTFGRGGGGGVVNRVTKKADGERVSEVTATTGSYERARTTIDVGDKISPDAAFRLNAMYENSESFRDYFELERYGINPTMAFRPTDSTKVSVSYEYFKDDRTVDRGVPSFNGFPSRGPIEDFFGNPDASQSNFEGQTATATLEHRFESGVNFRNHTFLATYEKEYSNTFANSPVILPTPANSCLFASGCVTLGGYINGTDRDTVVNQTDVTYRWDMGNGIRHTLLGGAEFTHQDTSNLRYNASFGPSGASSFVVPFDNPTTFTSVVYDRFQRNWHTEVATYSGYVQDQLEITRYFELIAGLRFDRFDVAFDGTTANVPAGNPQGLPQSISRIDDVWSHRVGAVFKPLETASIYIATSNSFLPGAGDQFGNLTTPVNGQTLAPEEFQNNEIGFKWEVAPRLFFTGAIFQLDRENGFVESGPGATEQVGLIETTGGELSLTGYVTDAWQISAGWGHQIATIVDGGSSGFTGNEVPWVPHNVYSLWNRYQFTSLFGAGLGIIHQDESFADSNNAVVLPAFTRVDAAFYFEFSETWQAQVNIENIFDEEYYPSAHNNNNISPGAPRQAFVTLRANF